MRCILFFRPDMLDADRVQAYAHAAAQGWTVHAEVTTLPGVMDALDGADILLCAAPDRLTRDAATLREIATRVQVVTYG